MVQGAGSGERGVEGRSVLGWMPSDSSASARGSDFQHHALAAAEGPVVDGAVPVVGKRAQIVHRYTHQSLGLGAAEDAVLEEAGEESGKDGDDVEAHGRCFRS